MHDEGRHHGDIRLSNFVFGEEGFLIDFDWSNFKTYPPGLQVKLSDTIRHPDAESGRKILKEHDLFSFGSICNFFNLKNGEMEHKKQWEQVSQLFIESKSTEAIELMQKLKTHQIMLKDEKKHLETQEEKSPPTPERK